MIKDRLEHLNFAMKRNRQILSKSTCMCIAYCCLSFLGFCRNMAARSTFRSAVK